MTTLWLVTRHADALAWLEAQPLVRDHSGPCHHAQHFDPYQAQEGDTVIGTLPIQVVARLTAKGVNYYHLTLNVPSDRRGQELTPEQMTEFGATLEPFHALPGHQHQEGNTP